MIDLVGYEVHEDLDAQFGRDDARTWLSLYQSMMWIFKGVNTIASSGAMIPSKIWDTSGDKPVENKKHRLNNLMTNPNALQTRYDLLASTLSYLVLTGNCYWFLERNQITKNIVKIHVVRPDRVEAKGPDELKNDTKETRDDQVSFFRKRASGAIEKWAMEDVVHFTFFNPLSDFQGWPPVGTLQDTGLLDLFLLEYGKSYFTNASRPSLVFTAKNRISSDSIQRFMSTMRRMHKGVKNFHRIMLLEEDIQPTELKQKQPTDSDYVKSMEHSQEKILTGLGIFHLVALLQNAQGQLLKDALNMFYEVTIDPIITNIEQTITKELLWPMEGMTNGDDAPQIMFSFDRRMVPGFREGVLDESIADFRNIQSGKFTVNEVRQERGASGDVSWGDLPPPPILALVDPEVAGEGMDENIGGSRGRFMPNEERGGIDSTSRGKTPRNSPAGDGNDVLKQLFSSDMFLTSIANLVAEKLEKRLLEGRLNVNK